MLWHDGKAFALVRLDVDAAAGDSFTYRVSSTTGSDVAEITIALPEASGCRADLDGDGSLTIFDFLAFQNEFDAGC